MDLSAVSSIMFESEHDADPISTQLNGARDLLSSSGIVSSENPVTFNSATKTLTGVKI